MSERILAESAGSFIIGEFDDEQWYQIEMRSGRLMDEAVREPGGLGFRRIPLYVEGESFAILKLRLSALAVAAIPVDPPPGDYPEDALMRNQGMSEEEKKRRLELAERQMRMGSGW